MGRSISQRLRDYAEREGRGYPDWAMRYMPIADRLRPHVTPEACVIEIGANACGFQRFCDTRVIAVDYELDNVKAAREGGAAAVVQADIAHLPFADNAADVCVCADTFEHLPKPVRADAVKEIARITKGAAAITFPSGEAARIVETEVQTEYEAFTMNRLPWWDEHMAYGLPDAAEITELFEEAVGDSHTVDRTAINSVEVWHWVWRVLLCNWPGRGNAIAQVIVYWLTPFLAGLHGYPCYRAAIFIEPRDE